MAGELALRERCLGTMVALCPHVVNLLLLTVFTELVLAEETEQDKEHTCETLLMCIVTVLSHGLRSGGGVGDVLRKPSKEVAGSEGKGQQRGRAGGQSPRQRARVETQDSRAGSLRLLPSPDLLEQASSLATKGP